MKPDRLVSLRLPDDLIDALARAARAGGRSPAELVRGVLEAVFLAEPVPGSGFRQVHDALGAARGWLDLQVRLRAAGFVLRLSEAGELALHLWPSDRLLLPIEALGTSLPALCIRFHAPFPGAVRRRAMPGGTGAKVA
ncbi:MAG: ribbon-helix-helix protein, CopG family [Pseudorhodobacter sp.]|nr:ribbon-helix-helix protein, CopG family [Pseudorhodobacter sp.]